MEAASCTLPNTAENARNTWPITFSYDWGGDPSLLPYPIQYNRGMQRVGLGTLRIGSLRA